MKINHIYQACTRYRNHTWFTSNIGRHWPCLQHCRADSEWQTQQTDWCNVWANASC